MRPLWDMRSVLCLPRLIMVCSRSLADMAALTTRQVKRYFCPSTVCTRESYWGGAVAGDILGDAALTITVLQRDVSSLGS